MNVKIMKPYGFCAGVEYVINFLHKIIEKHQGEKIYCLGQIVHNNRVNKEISDLGVEIIEGDKWESIEKIDHGVIVFSAHGTPKELIEKAVEKKLIVYDAVCPFVKKELEHVIKYSADVFEEIKALGACKLFEGSFFRVPVTKSETNVAPLKANYIELLNIVNVNDYDSHSRCG